jgi:hypothetical protein
MDNDALERHGYTVTTLEKSLLVTPFLTTEMVTT